MLRDKYLKELSESELITRAQLADQVAQNCDWDNQNRHGIRELAYEYRKQARNNGR